MTALPGGGALAELAYGELDAPNYYSLVLIARPDSVESAAAFFTQAGLPPDSARFAYRPLYHRPIFAVTPPTAPTLKLSRRRRSSFPFTQECPNTP